MPTYSYRCKACGDEFDIHQSFSDDTLTVCEACGGELRKLFNSVGIVFKGSGFYRNDARSSSKGLTPKDSGGSSETSSSEKSSTGSSEKSSTSTPAAPAAAS